MFMRGAVQTSSNSTFTLSWPSRDEAPHVSFISIVTTTATSPVAAAACPSTRAQVVVTTAPP